MKYLNILFVTAILCFTGCRHNHGIDSNFVSKRISKTASFVVNAPIEKVFPLYGAFEERKWVPTWKPVLIYPDKEIIEEGTTFKIDISSHHGHNLHSEDQYLWIVTKYQPENYLIQYLVSTENRFWTITLESIPIENQSKTQTTITYMFTGLNTEGNKLNEKSLDHMFSKNLTDWSDALNTFFQEQF